MAKHTQQQQQQQYRFPTCSLVDLNASLLDSDVVFEATTTSAVPRRRIAMTDAAAVAVAAAASVTAATASQSTAAEGNMYSTVLKKRPYRHHSALALKPLVIDKSVGGIAAASGENCSVEVESIRTEWSANPYHNKLKSTTMLPSNIPARKLDDSGGEFWRRVGAALMTPSIVNEAKGGTESLHCATESVVAVGTTSDSLYRPMRLLPNNEGVSAKLLATLAVNASERPIRPPRRPVYDPCRCDIHEQDTANAPASVPLVETRNTLSIYNSVSHVPISVAPCDGSTSKSSYPDPLQLQNDVTSGNSMLAAFEKRVAAISKAQMLTVQWERQRKQDKGNRGTQS